VNYFTFRPPPLVAWDESRERPSRKNPSPLPPNHSPPGAATKARCRETHPARMPYGVTAGGRRSQRLSELTVCAVGT
jgi:hypothetical protein